MKDREGQKANAKEECTVGRNGSLLLNKEPQRIKNTNEDLEEPSIPNVQPQVDPCEHGTVKRLEKLLEDLKSPDRQDSLEGETGFCNLTVHMMMSKLISESIARSVPQWAMVTKGLVQMRDGWSWVLEK